MTDLMPKPSEPIVDRAGHVTRSWRNYLSQLGGARSLDELWKAIAEIRQQLAQAGAGSFLRADTTVLGVNSVQTLGQLSDGLVRIQLDGDEPLPSPRQVYGVREDLSRGFMSFADMVAVGDGLAKALDYGSYAFRGELSDPGALPTVVVVGDAYLIEGDLWVGADEGRPDDPQWENAGPASPSPVLSLEELPDSGEGALLAITRDVFGRISGTRPVTAADIPGGGGTGGILPMVNGETPPVLMYGGNQLIYARVE